MSDGFDPLNVNRVPCALCGEVAKGWAGLYEGDTLIRLCHGDFDAIPTCYMRWTLYEERPT